MDRFLLHSSNVRLNGNFSINERRHVERALNSRLNGSNAPGHPSIRRNYQSYDPAKRFEVGKHASMYEVKSACRRYPIIPRTTINAWKKQYEAAVAKLH